MSDVAVAVLTPKAVPQIASGPSSASSMVTMSEESVRVPMPPRDRNPAPGTMGVSPYAVLGEPRASMTRIMVMSDVVLPLAEIKKRLSEIVDGVEERHDRVVLTRHGRPAAVIISPDELESLEETLELLSDPKAMRDIREGEAAVEAGEVVTADELRSRYLKR